MAGKILSLKEAAEILGVTPRTIQYLVTRGLIHGFRVGERTWKVEEKEIDAYIQRQKAVAHRQPGALEMIAEHVALFPEEEREELEQHLIQMIAAWPHAKVRLEDTGLVFTNALTPDGPITISTNEEKYEEKRAELEAAARR